MGLLERLVVTTVDRKSLRAAVAAAGVDPEPWSLAAWYVASDDHQPSPGVGRNDGDGSGALDADIVRLLCRATFVLEIGVVAAGLYVEHHYLHDGHLAMPVVSGADLSVGEPQPLRPLLEALAAEAVGGADGSLEADTVAREGALLIRTVHLGPEGCLAWPVIELVGPRAVGAWRGAMPTGTAWSRSTRRHCWCCFGSRRATDRSPTTWTIRPTN